MKEREESAFTLSQPLLARWTLGDNEMSLLGLEWNVVLAQENPSGFPYSWDVSSGTSCGAFQASYPCGFHIFLTVGSPISHPGTPSFVPQEFCAFVKL